MSEQEFDELLKNITAASIIDSGLCESHFPFIYAPKTEQKLFVGNSRAYHGSLLRELEGEPDYQPVFAAYTGYASEHYDHNTGRYITTKAGPGAVGRVGRNVTNLYTRNYDYISTPGYEDTEVVAFYEKEHTNVEVVKACVQALLEEGLIEPTAKVVYAKQVVPASELAGGASMEDASEEQIRLGKLQLGGWPDGRRLTPEERKWIQKELGIAGREMKKHPMQQGMEKYGLITPGHRWWAPTSEGREFLKQFRR